MTANLRRAVTDALANPELGEHHEITAEIRMALANMLMRSSDEQVLNEARNICQSAIRTYERLHGPNHPATLAAKFQLVLVSDERTDPADTAKQLYEVVKRIDPSDTSGHNKLLTRAYDNLALLSLNAGKPEFADEATKKLVDLGPLVHGKGHPYMRRWHGLRAWYLAQAGRYADAETEANKIFSPVFEPLNSLEGSWDDFSRTLGNCVLAMCILHKPKEKLTENDFKRAEKYLRMPKDPVKYAPKRLGPPRRREKLLLTHEVRLWIELYEKWEKPELAEPYRKELDQLLK